MKLTSNLSRFVEFQVSLWGDRDLAPKLPKELVDLLICREEWESLDRDSRGNRGFQHNSLFWSGRCMEPVVNQAFLEKISGNSPPVPVWPEGKKFAVCLSHDVDRLMFASWYSRLRRLKELLPRVIKNKSLITSKIKSLLSRCRRTDLESLGELSTRHCLEDKGDYFKPWLSLEERYGFRSTFFFFPDHCSRYHDVDRPMYRYNDSLKFEGELLEMSEVMRELDRRGHEVALHGTFYSFDDAHELKSQKEQVELAVQREVVSTRQHYLHFDITKTPRAQGEAGFKYDSTFGFNRIIGFRNGMAFPFHFYDLAADVPLPVLEIPLHIQDGALLSSAYLDLSPHLALLRAKQLIDRVEEARGLVTLLWHPNSVDEWRFPGWFWVYEELLGYIAQKDAWVAPVREIGNWWEQRRRLQGLELAPII